jgi:hypothetical protein
MTARDRKGESQPALAMVNEGNAWRMRQKESLAQELMIGLTAQE